MNFISTNSFLPWIVSTATIQFMKEKIAIMRKLYENFHIFQFQKRIVSAKPVCGDTVCTLTLLRKIYQQFGTFGIMFVTFSITTYIIVFILTFYDVKILDQTVPLQWVSYFCRLLWNSSSTCFNCWFTIWSYSHWANVNHGRFIASWNTIANSKIHLNHFLIWWQNCKNVQEILKFQGSNQIWRSWCLFCLKWRCLCWISSQRNVEISSRCWRRCQSYSNFVNMLTFHTNEIRCSWQS